MEAFGRWVNDRALLEQNPVRDYFRERMAQAAQTITSEVAAIHEDYKDESAGRSCMVCDRLTIERDEAIARAERAEAMLAALLGAATTEV